MLKSYKIYCIVLFYLGFISIANATHNRAGEITFKWVGPGLYTYEIKVTTYTNLLTIGGQSPADRCHDTVYFGDGTNAVVPRSNGPSSPDCDHNGVAINAAIKLNEYITTHTYPGPGNYRISMEDPNRNAGVINIPNSVNQVFYIESMLIIPIPFSGSSKNNSPILTFPPIDKGCVGKCFMHNPGAYDIDGDSLSYELTYCRGHLGDMCPGYTYPATGGGTYNVDPITGTLTWCTPQQQGEYNLAMIIKEWRKNFDGEYFMIGYILRDLQVDVGFCSNNPPSIQAITDTCVLAGSTITKIIKATDPDGDVITLSADGGPFGVSSSPATFNSSPSTSPVTGTFNWLTNCSHIRKTRYQVTIKAEDSDPQINLVDFKTFNITVVAPPPQNFTATPQGTNILLKWSKPSCHPTTGNKIERYCVYRKADCNPWTPAICETGVPASSGYVRIGCTASMNDTTFLDTNNGNGLTQGINYSYAVVAFFTDGAESYASVLQNCVQLKRDVPILVNVDVQSTDLNSGSVFVRWIKPILGPNALDTVAIPGPYEFRLMHHNGFTGTFAQVYSITKPYFLGINQLTDTTFVHNNINTQTIANTYKIEFYANGQFIGAGQKASSVFLSLTPSDNAITLNWQHQVPWSNTKYYIYRKDPGQTTYTVIGNTTSKMFVNNGLVNGATYCYKVQSEGQYSDPTIFSPLLNFSQEVCEKPKDMTAPCSPTLNIVSDCVTPSVILQWNNPNHVCSDDAIKYNLYFAETEDADLVFTSSITNMHDTILAFDNLSSIAGCYAITAVDSFGNESLQSAKLCVDNCPEYELPNVITINGDSVNDFFKPIKNRFIKDIDLKIYNRWGSIVFETSDPAIMWDGKVALTKQLCSEGTYYYICQVNEIRVKGIKKRFLHGFIQVFHK